MIMGQQDQALSEPWTIREAESLCRAPSPALVLPTALKGDGVCPVRVGFDRGDGPMAAAIRIQTRFPWAHVRLWIGEERWEAVAGKGVVRNTGPAPAEALQLHWPGWFDFELDAARHWANSKVGCGYDYPGVMAFVTRADRTSAELQAERKNRQVFFCSEFLAAFAVAFNRPLQRRSQPWQLSPGHVYWSWQLEEANRCL